MGDRSQDGTDDAELAAMSRASRPKAPNFYASSYEPTLRDQIAAYFIGDQMPTVERRRLVEGMLGSSGAGHTSLGLADIAPGGPGYWLDAFTHIDRGDYRGAAIDAAKAARVAVPYAVGGNVLRRGQALGRFALTVPEGAALVGVSGSFAGEHNGRNPLYGPGSAYGGDVRIRNRLAGE